MAASGITFYDIASGPPIRPYAPNPWKARYALNFTCAHSATPLSYKTSWTELPLVAATRQSLGVAPNRTHFLDGSDFHTLPVIVDHAIGKTVGDSFDIALYLSKTYPSREGEPVLFPVNTEALQRQWNVYVDRVFTMHAGLSMQGMPFDPVSAAESQAEFARRAGVSRWEDLAIEGEKRSALIANFEKELGEMAKLYVKRDSGPFLEGDTIMYADIIVGGWLRFVKETLPEWSAIKEWHGGLWGRLHNALEVYGQST